MQAKKEKILSYIKQHKKIAVMLSGGVDSALLLSLAVEAKVDVVALTFLSPLLSKKEKKDAQKIAKSLSVKHEFLESDEITLPKFVQNDEERCYYCKKRRLSLAKSWLEKEKREILLDGTNIDDLNDYRPGIKALEENCEKIKSPYLLFGLTKKEIRTFAKEHNLFVAEKEASACLASRIAHLQKIEEKTLWEIEKAEEYLEKNFKGQIRVRHHGNVARIEVEEKILPSIFKERKNISEELKKLGFSFVTIDLDGYKQGSQSKIFLK